MGARYTARRGLLTGYTRPVRRYVGPAAGMLLVVPLLVGCLHHTKVLATDVELSDRPLTFRRQREWKREHAALDLCFEPTAAYRREPVFGVREGRDPSGGRVGGKFLDASGRPVEVTLRLVAPHGEAVERWPERFYLNRNLACFAISPEFAPGHDRLELRSDPPMRVGRVYWYWYIYP